MVRMMTVVLGYVVVGAAEIDSSSIVPVAVVLPRSPLVFYFQCSRMKHPKLLHGHQYYLSPILHWILTKSISLGSPFSIIAHSAIGLYNSEIIYIGSFCPILPDCRVQPRWSSRVACCIPKEDLSSLYGFQATTITKVTMHVKQLR